MMILMSFSYSKVILGIMAVSLVLLVLYISYKKLLAYLGKGMPVAADYCVLYSLERDPVKGEIEIYFTTQFPKKVAIEVLNADMSVNQLIVEKEYSDGGHIIRFDTTLLEDNNYFFCLRTDNQKTMKKMSVRNK